MAAFVVGGPVAALIGLVVDDSRLVWCGLGALAIGLAYGGVLAHDLASRDRADPDAPEQSP